MKDLWKPDPNEIFIFFRKKGSSITQFIKLLQSKRLEKIAFSIIAKIFTSMTMLIQISSQSRNKWLVWFKMWNILPSLRDEVGYSLLQFVEINIWEKALKMNKKYIINLQHHNLENLISNYATSWQYLRSLVFYPAVVYLTAFVNFFSSYLNLLTS